MSSISITQLNIYPIKSAGGISLKSAQLDERGFSFDRRWMIVDPDGRFVTQREIPRLSLIRIGLESDHIRVHAVGMSDLHIPLANQEGAPVRVVVWDDTVQAIDAGEEPAAWLGEFLGVSMRLVRMTDVSDRVASMEKHKSQVTFADAYPLMLLSEGSLQDLNSRLSIPLPMDRFRPNIVVDGCGAFAEDSWQEIRAGDVPLFVVKPCARCVTTTVNQSTGEKGVEPLRTLAMFRRREGQVLFGQNIIHGSNGTLNVGDRIEVVSLRENSKLVL